MLTPKTELLKKKRIIGYLFYKTPAMDQKKFVYADQDIKQYFCKILSSGSDIINKPQYDLIQQKLKTELNKISDCVKDLVQKIDHLPRVKNKTKKLLSLPP